MVARRLNRNLTAKQRRTARFLGPRIRQTGTRKDLKKDRMIKAIKSGRRRSATGRVYWETRRNRSDFENDI